MEKKEFNEMQQIPTSSTDQSYNKGASSPTKLPVNNDRTGYRSSPLSMNHPNNRSYDVEEEEQIVAEMDDHPHSYHDLVVESNLKKLWKRDLYLILEDPASSRLALFVNLCLAGFIIFSVVLTTIETIPAVRELQWPIWYYFEVLVVLIFTVELMLRTAAHTGSYQQFLDYLVAPLTILDVFAVIPFYIVSLFSDDTSVEFRFTILRVFRLFRLFRTYKYSSLLQLSIEVMLVAIRKSLDALGALLFFMLMTIVLFSTFLYFAERGSWDDTKRIFVNNQGLPSEFDSIPAAFWFVIVTITTTGYGDIVPNTLLGKLIAFPLMMLGILLIALPSVIVGRNFTVVWDVMKRRRPNLANLTEDIGQEPTSLTEIVEDIELELAQDLPIANSTNINDVILKDLLHNMNQLSQHQHQIQASIQDLKNHSLSVNQQLNRLSIMFQNQLNDPNISSSQPL